MQVRKKRKRIDVHSIEHQQALGSIFARDDDLNQHWSSFSLATTPDSVLKCNRG
jgi:hypothetical protein